MVRFSLDLRVFSILAIATHFFKLSCMDLSTIMHDLINHKESHKGMPCMNLAPHILLLPVITSIHFPRLIMGNKWPSSKHKSVNTLLLRNLDHIYCVPQTAGLETHEMQMMNKISLLKLFIGNKKIQHKWCSCKNFDSDLDYAAINLKSLSREILLEYKTDACHCCCNNAQSMGVMVLQTQITSPSLAKIPCRENSHRSSVITSIHIRPHVEKYLKRNFKWSLILSWFNPSQQLNPTQQLAHSRPVKRIKKMKVRKLMGWTINS